MNKTYEITWSLKMKETWDVNDCEDEDDAVRKFDEAMPETIHGWSWDLAKDVEIEKVEFQIPRKKQYFRIDYTDFEWFDIMKSFKENLPSEYCDCFDRDGEYAKEYHDISTTDIYYAKGIKND